MSDKHFVGLKLTSFEDQGTTRPISRITLQVDDDNYITAGDDSGLELLGECHYATQAMADALLKKLKGYTYQMLRADNCTIDPSAELGDGVTANGVYGILARMSDDGNGYPNVEAPGEADLEDEYPVKDGGPITQSFNRKLAETRSTITKTADSITSTVEKLDTTLHEYADKVAQDFVDELLNGKIAEIQAQLDKQIMTWYMDGEPAVNKAPSNEWTNDTDKEMHEGDLYYDRKTGYCYRWTKSGSSWIWQRVEDSGIQEALANASTAQDTADGKRRVFVAQPIPPYDVGDLWTQGQDGDLMRCKTPKKLGEAYSLSDWEKAVKYTDDTELKAFLEDTFEPFQENIQTQTDGKAETWYQTTDPARSWTTNDDKKEHVGDLWYDSLNQKTMVYAYDSSGYHWNELLSNPPESVMAVLNAKGQIFVRQPTPPYNVGDLWTQGDGANGGALMRCKRAKTKGQSFSSSDWEAATDTGYQFSQIDQRLDSITLTVENGSTSSTIKLKMDGAEIASENISMSGLVTINSLKSSGSTQIDGSRITTGEISADRLDLSGCLTAYDIGSKGSTTISGDRIKTGTVKAEYLELDDYVTVGSLGKNGTTQIDGGRITTGEISANHLDLSGCLTAYDVGAYGSTTINGSLIKTGTVKAEYLELSGAITWSDLSSTCQSTIEGLAPTLPSYITSTCINGNSVSSPVLQGGMISGAQFMSSDQRNWIKMTESTSTSSTTYGYIDHYYSGYSSYTPVVRQGAQKQGSSWRWYLSAFNDRIFDYVDYDGQINCYQDFKMALNTDIGFVGGNTVYFGNATAHFGDSTVTNLHLRSSNSCTVEWACISGAPTIPSIPTSLPATWS